MTGDTSTVTSADGTVIAYERTGVGPPVVLVASALADRADARKLAARLSERFAVYNYDRRGRGASADTPPYAPEREIEDLEAVIAATGGSASVFGSSSGAVLALRAAAGGAAIGRLALFEPPLRPTADDADFTSDTAVEIAGLVGEGRYDAAVRAFMAREIGVPSLMLRVMRLIPPLWSPMRAMARTLTYDYTVMGDLPSGRRASTRDWERVTVPTLVLDGEKSDEHFRRSARLLAESLPTGTHATLAGQGHGAVMTGPSILAERLFEFFLA